MKKLAPYFLVILIITSGCFGISVTSDYDKEVDFTKFKTFEYYGWAEQSDNILNRFDRERIEKAFGAEFAKRGLKYVEKNGDIVVSLYIVVDHKTSKSSYTDHYSLGGYGPKWGWYGGYGVGTGSSTTQYTEEDYLLGTLVVDIFDKETKKLIWQSVGQKIVDEDPDTRDKNAGKVAAAIMEPYPVEPGD